MGESVFSLLSECVMCRFDENVKNNCLPFTCCNDDLDEFFSKDYALYADEMLGKTYCWVTISKPHKIVALVTLANDSIKRPIRYSPWMTFTLATQISCSNDT